MACYMERKALASSKAGGEGGALGMEVEAGINTAVWGGFTKKRASESRLQTFGQSVSKAKARTHLARLRGHVAKVE